MKPRFRILILGMIFFVIAGAPKAFCERLIFPLLSLECQSNIIVTATVEHPKACPIELTNLISNTNLISFDEQTRISKVIAKYKNVTTNSGPQGSILKKRGVRKVFTDRETTKYPIAYFAYTNSTATDEVWSLFKGATFIRSRTKAGDGYDLYLLDMSVAGDQKQAADGLLVTYQEYSEGTLNGLYLGLSNAQDSMKTHLSSYCKFQKGKIVGPFIGWDEDGNIQLEAQFLEPVDLLKCQVLRWDLGWAFENPIDMKKAATSVK